MEIQRKIVERERKYFENVMDYMEVVKRVVKRELGDDAEVFLFGSIVRGDFIIGKSDIDVLVVSEDVPKTVSGQTEIRVKALREIGDVTAPFEIHFADKSTFDGWYKKFIKSDILKV
jgi:predicted nucleotidyltransferase